ncbi:MAG: tetratricopeptide repeat protein [Pseudomonadota bacterium]
MRGLLLVLTAAILLLPAPAAEARDDSQKLLDFAKFLYESGDYSKAALEARRFLFLYPESPRRDEAGLLLGRSGLDGGKPAEAEQAFLSVLNSHDRPESAGEAALGLGLALERLDPARAEALYRDLISGKARPDADPAKTRNPARIRLGWLLLGQARWGEAATVFRQVDDPKLQPVLTELAAKAPGGENLPSRSPHAAGFMSALLPGAGQLYVGRPVDAGLALGFNALFVYGTVEAIQKEAWAAAAVLGLLEIAWYGGNIYNAVNGAHLYNRAARETFLKKLERDYGWTAGLAPVKGGALASLTWSF